MRILLTGGGSGGHFYPMIAVAEAIRTISQEERLVKPELIYMGPEKFDASALMENGIKFRHVGAGKMRRYKSIKNFFDIFKTFWGLVKAFLKVFWAFPDVIFSKGGYASFPVVAAARVFGIPIVIHESDTLPGKVNKWSAKFAKRVAISFRSTADLLPNENLALTGVPVRAELHTTSPKGAHEYLNLDPNIPTILILGGSQGAQTINDNLLEALPSVITISAVFLYPSKFFCPT